MFFLGLDKGGDSDHLLAQGCNRFDSGECLERELRPRNVKDRSIPVSCIIYNYGQGGSVWTMSVDHVGDRLGLVEEALQDVSPKPMMLRW